MKNRSHIQFSHIALATLGCVALVSSCTNQDRYPVKRPNVLFICIDDLNTWLSCYGTHPNARTPNFDRLAAKGTLFNYAYCAAPLSNPSRVSLLTGYNPSTSGVYQNPQPLRKALPQAITLTQYFKQHGYKVIGKGKIYHDNQVDTSCWSQYFKMDIDSTVFQYPQNTAPRGVLSDWRIAGGPMDIPDGGMKDTEVVNWAIDELNRKNNSPFFMAVGIWRPHVHLFAPRKYFDMFPADSIRLPKVNINDLEDIPTIGKEIARSINDHKNILENGMWRKVVAAYLANVAYVDTQIGRLLDALEKSPHAKNTIVVLFGDNGWHLGEKLHWQKFSLWEEGTRVPLMIIAPGIKKQVKKSNQPVSLVDLYPTLIDLCSLPLKKDLDGKSLKPLISGQETTWNRPALSSYGYLNHSLRTSKWRYIRYNDGTEELYDHSSDSLEWVNLASNRKFKKVVDSLKVWLPATNKPNAPAGNGNTRIPMWHEEYSFLEGRPVFITD